MLRGNVCRYTGTSQSMVGAIRGGKIRNENEKPGPSIIRARGKPERAANAPLAAS